MSTINSREYWNARFETDWEQSRGREQTRGFAHAALRHLNPTLASMIRSGHLSVCDFGCALGDAVPILAGALESPEVVGVDFAEAGIAKARALYPGHTFLCGPSIEELGREFDVVFTSNTLEHLSEPNACAARLARIARRFLIVLVPFRENPRIAEHAVSFDYDSFPLDLGPHRLIFARDFDLDRENPQCWPGRQILLAYSRRDWVPPVEPRLSWFTSASDDHALRAQTLEARAASAESRAQALETRAAAEEQLAASLSGQVARAQGLEKRLIEEGRRAEALEQTVDRLSSLADHLSQLEAEVRLIPALEARAQRVPELERQLSAMQAQMASTDEALAAARAEGARLEQLVASHQRTLNELYSGNALKVAFGLWSARDRLLAQGTRRRHAYDGAVKAAGRVLRLPAPDASAAPPAAPSVAAGAIPPFDPAAQLAAFERRPAVRGASTVVALASATQLVESEGQRPMRLALELSRRGIPVVFLYWRWWPTDLRPQDHLSREILQIPIDTIAADPDLVFRAFEGRERFAFFEFPHPSLIESLAAANAEGWVTIYEALDDWREFQRVGQCPWWDEQTERHYIAASDMTFAVSPFLAERIRALGGERVALSANGLCPEIAAIGAARPLERGEVTVGYFGHLTSAWFDWELVAAAARARPSWRFYLIGYGGSPGGVALPANVAVLGKKTFGELASYAANWDVAVVPFKSGPLAAGADPIKTYEYLALGLPVVATGVLPPPGAESLVHRAEGLEDFLAQLAAAAAEQGRAEERKAYASRNTWAARVEKLLAAARSGEQGAELKQALFEGKQ